MASESCCSSSDSSPSPPSCLLFPLRDRFIDIPEPMKSQMIGATIKIMQDNIRDIAIQILQHGLGWAAAGGRCRACIAELARAVKAAEDAGVQVEEEWKSLLTDWQDQEGVNGDEDDEAPCRGIYLQEQKRQREEDEEKEGEDREFKRRRNSILAYMKSLEEAQDEEEDEEEEDEDDEILEIYD